MRCREVSRTRTYNVESKHTGHDTTVSRKREGRQQRHRAEQALVSATERDKRWSRTRHILHSALFSKHTTRLPIHHSACLKHFAIPYIVVRAFNFLLVH